MARSEPTRRVVLIGFMGAGKTSVGRALAARLEWNFCDLDNIIETREQQTVAAIFADRGEAGFRKAESAALRELLQDSDMPGDLVLALGGGAFVQPANRAALERSGAATVLLEAPLEELRRRCQEGGNVRPLARDAATFSRLFAERRSAYQLAQHRVDTMGKSVEQVAEEIERLLAAGKPEVKQ
ncbi:MAG: shikimate kinase [Acidobacteriia bacterium]|nr:shikimate kinase [Terriglobia bacterium]